MICFSLLGCRFRIGLIFCAAVTFMLLTDKTGAVSYILLAILLHESGHIAAMLFCRAQIKEINLLLFSVDVNTPDKGKTLQHLLINSGGILSNAFFALLFYTLYRHGFATGFLSAANIAVGAYNLLPVKGLDGFEILSDLFCLFSINSNRALKYIGIAFRLGFFALLMLFFFKTKNPLPVLFGIYLFTLG